MKFDVSTTFLIDSVKLNGKLLKQCFFIDTKRNKVRVYKFPYKIHKHKKEFLSKTLYGDLEITYNYPLETVKRYYNALTRSTIMEARIRKCQISL